MAQLGGGSEEVTGLAPPQHNTRYLVPDPVALGCADVTVCGLTLHMADGTVMYVDIGTKGENGAGGFGVGVLMSSASREIVRRRAIGALGPVLRVHYLGPCNDLLLAWNYDGEVRGVLARAGSERANEDWDIA